MTKRNSPQAKILRLLDILPNDHQRPHNSTIKLFPSVYKINTKVTFLRAPKLLVYMESYLFRPKVTSKLPQSYLFELAQKSYFSRLLKKSYLSYLSYLLFIYFLNFFKNKKYVAIYGFYII